MSNDGIFYWNNNTLLINHYFNIYAYEANDFDVFHLVQQNIVKERIDQIKRGKKDFPVYNKVTKFLYNELSVFNPQSVVVLYTCVRCESASRVILDIDFAGTCKVWINGKVIFCGRERQNRRIYNTILDAGDNDIVIEYLHRDRNYLAHGFIQIYDYFAIIDKKIYTNLFKVFEKNYEFISSYNADKRCVEFMCLNSYNGEKKLKIIARYSNYKKELMVKARTKYILEDISLSEKIDELGIYVSNEWHALITLMPEKAVQEVLNRATSKKMKESEKDTAKRLGILAKISKDYLPATKRCMLLNDLLAVLEGGKANNKRVYYFSSIDESYQEISVSIPESYNEDSVSIRYPLVLYLVDKEEKLLSEYIQDKEFIIADIYGGGILGGGYVSEARYLEVLDRLNQLFSIDNDRIFIVGQSHTGFDAWALAENRPDLAAAYFLLSGSPYYPNLQNAANTHIFNVVSDYDYNYRSSTQKVENEIDSEKYEQHNLYSVLHGALAEFTLFDIINFFRDKVKEKEPTKICFRTERNRYLSAFWIKTYGIEEGKNFLKIVAEVLDRNTIQIEAINCIGIEILLPQTVCRNNLKIVVNGQIYIFKQCIQNKVSFVKESNGKYLMGTYNEKIDYRKGTGLLDVYFGELRIYLKEKYTDKEYEVAKNFSTPKSYGVVRTLNVSYPIRVSNRIDFKDKKCNLILINYDLNHIMGGTLHTAVKCTTEYFEYKGEKYVGDYCVMQITCNTNDESKSILLINANNDKFLKKNIFLRNVILPFMFNGFHEYYNQEILVLYEKNYYTVYESNAELKKVK